MKFGKQIQAEQVPGWSEQYLDYKALKKIISAAVGKRPGGDAPELAPEVERVAPGDLFGSGAPEAPADASAPAPDEPESEPQQQPQPEQDAPPIIPAGGSREDRDPAFSKHKALFFFKLERELEKINTFYLRKEAESKHRVETLLAQRRAAAMRVLPDAEDDNPQNHVEWTAVEEGFRQLERDLGKLQHFVELNATGFRKILKKWDKRAKSTTKELYLARQVDVQPVFDRQLISELSDIVAACLLDITDLSTGFRVEKPGVNELIFTHQIATERSSHTGPFYALESDLRKAVAAGDEAALREVVKYSDTLASQQWGGAGVTRILWKAVIDAPPDLADLILSLPATPFDFRFIDDVSGRTCLHEAVMANAPRLVNICLRQGVDLEKLDVYGRTAVHYACIAPAPAGSEADATSARILQKLLEAGLAPDILDLDNYSPLLYAILRGSVERVRVLLDVGRVSALGSTLSGDLIPLSLACQAGCAGVATLLLDHGATCVANTNGEYPMHLAAREGHADICRLLVGHEGWDAPDKYHDWTPVFHAARHGRDACLQVLIEAGGRVGMVDEFGNHAAYYAAWNGHRSCVTLLLEAVSHLAPVGKSASTQISPLSQGAGMSVDDLEHIPSLALPPPIMPYRVYGHNFLEKTSLIQVMLGSRSHSAGDEGAIRLHPRLSGIQSRDQYLHASPFLRLVITPKPDTTSAPCSVSLPLPEGTHVFSFQVPAVDGVRLEFSLYPSFGTKSVGRAVVLPVALETAAAGAPLIVPFMDPRLHIIGEITIEAAIVRPFTGITLGIGGGVETYWKSMALPVSTSAPKGGALLSGAPAGSTATSPSNHSGISYGGHATTISSITGAYLHAVVQLTRDGHPVVYAERELPELDYDLCVSDVTFPQFEALATRKSRRLDAAPPSLAGWRTALKQCMVSLRDLLQMLPPTTGLCIELAACSSPHVPASQRTLDVNQFVDCVLRAVYPTLDAAGRRRIVFTSFSPDVCAALNWKQPNYPVFFASACGRAGAATPSPGADVAASQDDRRSATVATAVEFAKANNILGMLLDAELLAQVPSVIQGIKDTGLLVGTFGTTEETAVLSALAIMESAGVDAVLGDGMLTCLEQSMRALL